VGGDFPQTVLDVCEPSELVLIDNWTFDVKQHTTSGLDRATSSRLSLCRVASTSVSSPRSQIPASCQ